MAVNKVPYLEHLKQFGLRESALIGQVAQTAADAIEEQAEQITALSDDIAAHKPFVKIFSVADWENGTITISKAEHQRSLDSEDVISRVYMLSGGKYSDQCLAAMDTEVSVTDDKRIVLSYGGEGYDGKAIFI